MERTLITGTYTQLPLDTFESLQLNAGIFLTGVTINDNEVSAYREDIIGATTGGATIAVTPQFKDMGEGIDNCPANMKELKEIDYYEIKASGSFVAQNIDALKKNFLAESAPESDGGYRPKRALASSDFRDVWWIGDYGKNSAGETGYLAIKFENALSTGGFSIKSTDKNKGEYAFEYTAHYTINAPTTPPVKLYAYIPEVDSQGADD